MALADPRPLSKHSTAWNSEAKYRTLFESIDEGLCVIEVIFDGEGNAIDYEFLETNPSFERQTGLVDAVGRAMRSLAPAHEEHWFRIYGDVARSGKPVRFEAPAKALGRWYDVYAFRVGEPEERLVAILFNDVSMRKQLEKAIEEQNLALREADLRKDVFLATLAHELRNPLAPLKVAAELLTRPSLTDQQLARTREIIRRQVDHMARLLDDLLDIARATQGKLTLRRERVRPTELIESAVDSVRPLIERKRHTLDMHLDPNPPVLDVDPIRISQIVANLLTNAAKYTDSGGHITLSTRVEGGAFVIEIRDDGIGIPPEALANLFKMFSQQQAQAERSEGGLGIGLALVKGLVELHGGSVQAESEGPGRGSRFTVRIPIA
jgi:Signal transduction histidine kinase